ncbi:MAG: hypothetical protein ACI3XI_06005 [Eubacteriales bacterium]
MKKLHKLSALILACVILLAAASGCASSSSDGTLDASDSITDTLPASPYAGMSADDVLGALYVKPQITIEWSRTVDGVEENGVLTKNGDVVCNKVNDKTEYVDLKEKRYHFFHNNEWLYRDDGAPTWFALLEKTLTDEAAASLLFSSSSYGECENGVYTLTSEAGKDYSSLFGSMTVTDSAVVFACEAECTDGRKLSFRFSVALSADDIVIPESVEDDYTSIVEQASQNMQNLRSYTCNSTIALNLSVLSVPFSFTVDEYRVSDYENNRHYFKNGTGFNGTVSENIRYIDEGVFFLERGENRYKATLPEGFDIGTLIDSGTKPISFSASDFDSYNVYESADGYLVQIKGLANLTKFEEMLDSAGISLDMFEITELEMEIRLDKDLYYSSVDAKFKMVADIGDLLPDSIPVSNAETTVHLSINYTDINSSSNNVTVPDMTGATELPLDEIIK